MYIYGILFRVLPIKVWRGWDCGCMLYGDLFFTLILAYIPFLRAISVGKSNFF